MVFVLGKMTVRKACTWSVNNAAQMSKAALALNRASRNKYNPVPTTPDAPVPLANHPTLSGGCKDRMEKKVDSPMPKEMLVREVAKRGRSMEEGSAVWMQ